MSIRSIIFLCGGKGTRFRTACPQRKPCQLIYSIPMYNWVLETIIEDNLDNREIILAIPNDDNGHSILYNVIKRFQQTNIKHVCIDYDTRGPIETCKLCLSRINNSFWVLDNDILYDDKIDWNMSMNEDDLYIVVQKISKEDQIKYEHSNYSPYGHVVLDEETHTKVVDIVEKKYVGNYIVLGAYGFGSPKLYDELFAEFVSDDNMYQNEWFMSSLFKKALEKGKTVHAVFSQSSVPIGTPEQVEEAIESGCFIPKPLRWSFDLDETLVSLPVVKGDYSTVRPIEKVIDFVRYLYKHGHYIIIHTARHMKTCEDDVELVEKKVGRITRETLTKFNIPYHELVFGKPYADVYVDDKSTNPLHWQDGWTIGSIGFGWNKHLADCSIHKKIKKLSDNLCIKIADPCEAQGNMYFIQNCPSEIVHHIPLIHTTIPEGDKVNMLMEWKNDAVPIGKLMSHNLVTDDVFQSVLKLLKTMHSSCTKEKSDLISIERLNGLIMQNYLPKLRQRLTTFDIYSKFDIDTDVIQNFFDQYTPRVSNCIHGDFWMSNLLWSHKEKKVYMIDMRGRLGDTLTTFGDRNYDLSKLYQSIVGFDSIIHTGNIPCKDLQNRLLSRMRDELEIDDEHMENIKKITAFLILGSMPFHEELIYQIDNIKKILKELWPCVLTI